MVGFLLAGGVYTIIPPNHLDTPGRIGAEAKAVETFFPGGQLLLFPLLEDLWEEVMTNSLRLL